jgi:hypothetical protein
MQLRNFKFLLTAVGCFVTIGANAAAPSTWWNDNPWADPDRGFNW